MLPIKFKCNGQCLQILSAITASINTISDGMQYGWSAPVLPILLSEGSPVKISTNDENFLESIYLAAGLLGIPFTIYLANKLGRKKLILSAALTSLVAWIIMIVANRVEYLYVARCLAGMAADISFVTTPMYISEISDQEIRGFLTAIVYVMLIFGVFIVYSVAPFTSYIVPNIVGAGVIVVQLLTFIFMPESPYYYLFKGDREAARKSLDKLKGRSITEAELDVMSKYVVEDTVNAGSFRDLICVPSNRKAFIIATFLTGAQHFSAATVILMNLHTILEKADSIYLKTEHVAIIYALIMTAAGFVACIFVDKLGRKFFLVFSGIGCGLCLTALSVYFHLKYLEIDTKTVSWIPIVSCMIYAVVLKVGLGIMPEVLAAEMFPTNVKAKGMSLTDGVYIITSVASVELYYFLIGTYGYHVPFYIFAVVAFGSAIFTVVYVPETKGKSLEEIQLVLQGR